MNMPVRTEDHIPQVTSLPAVTPMQMLQIAMERGADLDKMQQLMDLNDRWEATQARRAYVAAMAAFKANPPEIVKGKQVNFTTSKGTTNYKHATLADVCTAAIKGLADHGISHRWDVAQADGRIKVTCVLTHEQGHSESVSMHAPADDSGSKNAIQAIGSAVTYLQRYTLLAATGLAARDQDDDGRGSSPPQPINANQVADLEALITEVGADRAMFLRYLKVERLEDLPATKYTAAVAALRARGGK